MKRLSFAIGSAAVVVSLALVSVADASLRGGGGGGHPGGGARAGGGGGARPGGGGGARPGGGGGARPGGGAGARPNVGARPGGGAPHRPSTGSLGGGGHISAPNINRPAGNKPNVNRPSAPSRPNIGQGGSGLKPGGGGGSSINLPNRPGGGAAAGNRPNIGGGGNAPGNRPSLPSLGGGGQGGNRPGGGNLPNRPGGNNRPGGGIDFANRPGGGGPGGNRPGGGLDLPNRPGGGNLPNRPGAGGGGRPSPGDVGDFLGLDRPMRPGQGGAGTQIDFPNRPGGGGLAPNRPGDRTPGGPGPNRPGDIVRPGDRTPGGPGPIRPGGPGNGLVDRNRPINVNNVNVRKNNVINNRPTWANIDNSRMAAINNGIGNQIGGMRNWQNVNANRIANRGVWGNDVRGNWNYRRSDCFGPNWWNNHNHSWAGWSYGYGFANRSWSYWWTVPTFAACTSWFSWSNASPVWQEPVYYDYGQGGNVYYDNDVVYVNGEQVASADEYAQSAMALATVPPPATEEQAAQAEWLPLGTFAVSTEEKDVDPTRVIQLAVDKQGVVSGTMYNEGTDQAYTVQGQVDKETQRVAFRVGESESLVLETGLYNLTQNEAPVLVHYGTERTENWLFVRLEEPPAEDAASATSAAP